jgi:hypothetical protein
MEPMAFGFCMFVAAICNSALVHTLQPELLLIGINEHARLLVSFSNSNLTFGRALGGCVCPAFYLGTVLSGHLEHHFVFLTLKGIIQCEAIHDVHKELSGGRKW